MLDFENNEKLLQEYNDTKKAIQNSSKISINQIKNYHYIWSFTA